MTNEHSIAFKYAKALFLSAKERGALDEVAKDAERIISTLKTTPELNAFLKNPAASERDAAKATRLIFHDTVNDATLRFLSLLSKNGRDALLKIALERFLRFADEERKIVRARLEYAGELSNDAKRSMRDYLQQALNASEVVLEEIERPELIAGTKLTVNGKQYDRTVLAAFKTLKNRLNALAGV